MMGSGKSTVGPLVAQRLGLGFADTDRMVEAATAMRLPALWAIDGGTTFRLAEAAAVAAVASEPAGTVIAAGGGAVLDSASADLMRGSGIVVWLTVEPEVAAGRVDGDGDRPLLADSQEGSMADRLAAILEERRDRYEAAAHHRVATDDLTAAGVARSVEALWLAPT